MGLRNLAVTWDGACFWWQSKNNKPKDFVVETPAGVLLSYPVSVPSFVPKSCRNLQAGMREAKAGWTMLGDGSVSPRTVGRAQSNCSRTHPSNKIVLIHIQQQSL